MYTCARCTWVFRVENGDSTAGQAAFEAHLCEDFPRDEGEMFARLN
jgi:rubredoxin